MARASTNSLSPPKKESRQFSITSFLPKASGSSFTPTPPPVSGSKKRKRKVESSEEEELEVSDLEEPPPVPAAKKDSKGKGKAKVIDLTLDDEDQDDIIMPPPPVRPLKKVNKVEQQKDKGKGKAKRVETKVGVEEMWVDKFAPTSREELSVHKKKISDVEGWLLESLSTENPKLRKYRRLLVMSGPSGAGKTACLRMLCQELGVEILEWKEESRVLNAGDEYGGSESMVNRFTSFLSRAGMAPSLDFGDSDSTPSASTSTSTSTPSPSTSSNPRRLILLEDLPNVSHYPTKLALRSALSQFLTSPRVTCPLVLIVSEALTRPGNDGVNEMIGGVVGGGREESLDSRGVCGLEVLQHPACREISFNPIAVTIMKKSLIRILDQIYVLSSSSSSTSSRSPSSSLLLLKTSRPPLSTLEAIISNCSGDIRSALMSLQFLSTQSSSSIVPVVKGGGGGKGKKKAGGGDWASIVSSRENSLFIFHALGKVLYNKRWGDSDLDDKKDLGRVGIVQPLSNEARKKLNKLPKHLKSEWGGKGTSKVDPDVLFAEAPIDSDVFLLYLHHNYPQFTNSSIESCSTILDGLSQSDSLLRLEESSPQESQRRIPLTSLYSFAVGVRTALCGLPSPVERKKQSLRKSEWWECEKVRKLNLEGVGELISAKRGGGGGLGLGEGGVEGGVSNSTLRDRKSLTSELIPWLGVIKPPNVNPFLLDLATFPPLSSVISSGITGEALGEKDVNPEAEEGAEEEEEEKPVLTRFGDVGSRVIKLEELEQDEEEDGDGVALAMGKKKGREEKGWFEEEDDIVD